MNRYIAEAIGTFVLVFFGVGSAVLAGGGIGIADSISITGISLAFGISVVAMAYSIGQVSGAHLNPAVSIGAMIAGRMTPIEFIMYSIFQTGGAIAAAGLIFVMATNTVGGYDIGNGLGQNGWGPDYGGEFFMVAAFIFEVVATAVFLIVILGVTSEEGGTPLVAGLVIGLTLTMIHLVGITVTGTSVNPARSIGPALFVGGTALSQLWLFIVAPLIGGVIGGLIHRSGILGDPT